MLAILEAYMGYILLAGIVVSHFIPSPSEMLKIYDQGKTQLVMEDYSGAREQFSRIVENKSPFLTSDSIYITIQDSLIVTLPMACYYQIGNIERREGNYEKAIENFSHVRQMRGNNFIRALAQYQIIQSAYAADDYDEVIAQADTLIERFPNSNYVEQAHYNKGWAYYQLQDYPGAVNAFRDLIHIYSDGKYTVRALMKQAQAYEQMEDWENASATYQTVIDEHTPKSFTERDWSGVALQKLKAQTQTESKIALGQDSDEILKIAAKAYMKIGGIAEKMERWDAAIKQYTIVVNTFVRMRDVVENAYLRIAEITFDQQGVDAAVAVYSKAMDTSMSRVFQAKMQYAKVLLLKEKGVYQRANQELTIYMEGFEDVADQVGLPLDQAMIVKGQLTFDSGQYSASAATYQTMLDSFPQSDYRGEALFNQALAYYSIDKWPEAVLSLERMRKNHPKHPLLPQALLQMGRILMEQKQYEPALALYDTVLTRFAGTEMLDTNNVLLEIGYTHRDRGDYDKAIRYLRRIAPESDYYSGAMSEISEIYLSKGETEEARKILLKALAALTDTQQAAEFHYFLGRLYIKTQEFDRALEEFNQALANLNNQQLYNSSLIGRGTIYIQLQEFEKAIADFESVLKQPDNGNFVRLARDRLIRAYGRTGQTALGEQRIQEWLAVTDQPTDRADLMLLQVQLLITTGEFTKSRRIVTDILKLEIPGGTKARAYYFRGNAWYQEGNFSAALNDYGKALPLAQQADVKGNLVYQIGLCHFLLEEYVPDAYKEFQRVITEFPENANREYAFYYRAFSQMNANIWPAAIRYFKIFLERYPQSQLAQEVTFQIGEAYYNAKSYPDAIAYYQQVADKELLPQSLYNIAWSFVQLDSSQVAMTYFERIANEFPDSDFAVFSQFTVGDYFYNLKMYDEAVAAYEKVVNRYPGHELAEKARDLIDEIGEIESYLAYEAAMVYFDDEDWPKAIEELEKVLEKYGSRSVAVGALVNIGSAYEQLGKYQKALEYFDRVVEGYSEKSEETEAVAFARDHAEWIRRR
ncbi:MAG: tetratricopeptide repeat protein [Candidatus Marinimicrobia bacterium]|nr:tetratricopeptide repeat protein [Candidatus Neomarinimicrobiota bacterium]